MYEDAQMVVSIADGHSKASAILGICTASFAASDSNGS